MDILTDDEFRAIYAGFFDDEPLTYKLIDTSREYNGVKDFRNTFITETSSGIKRVIKLCENSFTFPERLKVWQRAIEEYISLGCYCPRIIADKSGDFPYVEYKGHRCTAFAEEYSIYAPLEDRGDESSADVKEPPQIWRDKWLMTARVANKHFDFTDFPSGYCLFERFCETDKNYEVLDDALEWKGYADKLPEEFKEQVERIWQQWIKNRDELEKVYPSLPTSVFQADLNTTNLLVDENGKFKGVYDFNLCGKDSFLNYLFRENFDADFDDEIELIRNALAAASEEYTFSKEEREYALMLYRCLKPLRRVWIMEELLKGGDKEKIKEFLDKTEHYLNTDIDFKTYMNGGKVL